MIKRKKEKRIHQESFLELHETIEKKEINAITEEWEDFRRIVSGKIPKESDSGNSCDS
jgi:formiminotetrahydrofolate cyclodeaminase